MTEGSETPCTARHIHHVCIAVRDIEATLASYTALFNLEKVEIREVKDQGVKAALVKIGGSELEFIEPTDPNGGIARFIEKKGEGLHHVCFEVDDLQKTLDRLAAQDIQLIDKAPRQGLAGMIAFLHPRATGGTLIELVDKDTVGR
ncbi:MAG: methylmalonyl-CoA epimerase [Chloroflexi bacterium]|nr:methylmalonyl-CoA epimerase [Chloroflexota bacterium]